MGKKSPTVVWTYTEGGNDRSAVDDIKTAGLKRVLLDCDCLGTQWYCCGSTQHIEDSLAQEQYLERATPLRLHAGPPLLPRHLGAQPAQLLERLGPRLDGLVVIRSRNLHPTQPPSSACHFNTSRLNNRLQLRCPGRHWQCL